MGERHVFTEGCVCVNCLRQGKARMNALPVRALPSDPPPKRKRVNPSDIGGHYEPFSCQHEPHCLGRWACWTRTRLEAPDE